MSDETDEAYCQGEELRKQAPYFPEELYKNLPDLLNECILDDEDDRGKDISFLSDLTALSAALPQTFGIYNHKKYSPHLLEDIHQWILSNSQHQQKIYNQEHIQWQSECSQKKKSHEGNDLSPEIYCEDVDFERSLQIVLCCYEHSRLLLSSMASPNIRPLKKPNIIRNFINDLPASFTTEEAIRIGAKYNFNTRKINRLPKSLNGLEINKVSYECIQRYPKDSTIYRFCPFVVLKSRKNHWEV